MVLRPLGLGDLLTAVPALRALADAFPGHRRVLAAPSVLEPLAAMTGAVDEVAHTEPLVPLHPSLEGADVAVDLHGKGPASHRVLLASRPRRLVAFANPAVAQSRGFPEWRADEHEVVRWCRLLSQSGIPADPSRLDLDPPPGPLPAGLTSEGARGATLVHPGAAFAARRWPPERWAAVAGAEAEAGRRVLVSGGPDEVDLAREVARRAGLPAGAVCAGRTNLTSLARLVTAAACVACADTGVAHLATALRTPSVVLFGPTSPRHWGPPPDRPWHRVLWAGTTGDPRGAEPDPGLLAITVDAVVEALARLRAMGRRSGSPAASMSPMTEQDLPRPAPTEAGVPAIDEVGDEILATGDAMEGELPPLEHPQGVEEHGITAAEQQRPESLDHRLAREEPDVAAPADVGSGPVPGPDTAGGVLDPLTDLLGDEEAEPGDTLAPEEAALRLTQDLPGATEDASPGYLEES